MRVEFVHDWTDHLVRQTRLDFLLFSKIKVFRTIFKFHQLYNLLTNKKKLFKPKILSRPRSKIYFDSEWVHNYWFIVGMWMIFLQKLSPIGMLIRWPKKHSISVCRTKRWIWTNSLLSIIILYLIRIHTLNLSLKPQKILIRTEFYMFLNSSTGNNHINP